MAEEPKDPKALRKIAFPFPKTDNRNPAEPKQVEIRDAQEYFRALSQAQDGFYPIGYNGQWHGGIHFGAETGTSLAQDVGIRCIADGEVIAYRIDDDYPTVEYQTCAAAIYSRGFVLIRHRLQLPPAPRTTQTGANAQANTKTPPQAEPSLVFYSLYMHLRNWKAYASDTNLKRPAFWDGATYLVGTRALDSDRSKNTFIPVAGGTGSNLRDADNKMAGFAPRGVKLKLGEAHSTRRTYYQISEVVEGTTYPDNVVGLYAYKGTGTSREGLDSISEPLDKGAVHLLQTPVEIKAGDLIGHLGQYHRYSDMNPLASSCTDRPLVHLEVFTGQDLQQFITQSRSRDPQLDAKQKTLLHIKPGARFVQPAEPDIDLPADEAAVFVGGDAASRWVKGKRGTVGTVNGNPAGFVSATRTYADGRIFISAINPTSGDELGLEALEALSSTAKRAYTQRKLLTPAAGDVWLERNAANALNTAAGPVRLWSDFPLKVANASGDAAAHSRVVPIKSADTTAKEADGTRWFRAEAGGGTTGSLIGWVREKDHPDVVLCSPWAWPGFVLMDTGTLQPKDLYGRLLDKTRQALTSERRQMESLGQSAEQSPLFDALCRAIDTDGKDNITPLELRAALGKPWLTQTLSRLAIKHHSEWAGPMDRWDAIDELIPEPRKQDWTKEKARIRELQFWDNVKGNNGFPTEPKVHHLHPVGFVENFLTGRDTTTYRIHQNGRIEKLPPSEETDQSIRNARYIYVGTQGTEHDFGVFEGTKATRWVSKNTLGTELIYLMDASDLGQNPAALFGFRFTGTERRYLNQSALASLIGTLMDTGYNDVTTTGFSMRDGSPGVSSSHINGENGDFRFLRNDLDPNTPTHLNTVAGVDALDEGRQGIFNNSLHKFGWTTQLSWQYTKDGEQRLLPRTIHYDGHHHHLHVGGYAPNLEEVA